MNRLPDIKVMDVAKRSQLKANAERLLQTGKETQKTQAKATLEELRRLDGEERQALREAIAELPTTKRVAKAFTALPPTDTEATLLRVLLDNPDKSSEALSVAMKWKGNSWHMHFGKMCERRKHLLWAAEPSETRDANFYCGILVTYSHSSHGFTMKPEAAHGLAAIGIFPSKRGDR